MTITFRKPNTKRFSVPYSTILTKDFICGLLYIQYKYELNCKYSGKRKLINS